MGKAKPEIAPVFQNIHFGNENICAVGHFRAERGKGMISLLLGLPLSIPTDGEKTFRINIDKYAKEDVWAREFDTKVFVTKVINNRMSIRERYGIFEFNLDLVQKDGRLNYEFKKFKVLNIGLPKSMSIMPSGVCRALSDSQWSFEVDEKRRRADGSSGTGGGLIYKNPSKPINEGTII